MTIEYKVIDFKGNEGLTQQKKIEAGLIRPYSFTADRMIIEDIENGVTVEEIAQLYNRDVEDLKQHIEQIKGKVKSCRLKGNAEAFADLYAAIWANALEDELKHQIARLQQDVSEKIFSGLLIYDPENRNTYVKISGIVAREYGKLGTKLLQQLDRLIDENTGEVKKAVQRKMCREALAWPNNRRREDSEYEKEYLRIRDSILDAFSKKAKGGGMYE